MSPSPLQDLLVRKSLLTRDQICQAIAYGLSGGATWLEQLLLWRSIDEETLAHCLGEAAVVPRCDLDRLARLPYDVLGLVPGDIAAEHRLIPMGVEPDGELRIAMTDPTDETAVEELEFFLDRKIMREVAPASAIAWALHRYHGVETPLWTAERDQQVRQAA